MESLWVTGGFTEEAKSACAKRMLELIKANDLSACYAYVDAIEEHVHAIETTPGPERRTTADDVKTFDD